METAMAEIHTDIRNYIEQEIIPRYQAFDQAHSIGHVQAVIADSISLALSCGADVQMAYVIAAYHDTGMVDGRETHHLASGRILMADRRLRQWFTEEQLQLMKEAVEDHRASGKTEPRSIYGKIVADADREIGNLQPMRRTIQFGRKHYPELDKEASYRRFREHMFEKYARGGYLHLWIADSEKARELSELQDIIADENSLRSCFEQLWTEISNQ